MLFALCAGCSISGGDVAPVVYVWDLPVADNVKPPSTARAERPVLLLAPPIAAAAVDTTGIAYSDEPLALGYYRDSRWADTPARMLETVLARALDQSGQFRAVLTQPSVAAADYTLRLTLARLRQEFWQLPSRVRVELRAELTDNSSGRVLAAQRFDIVAAAPSENAGGGVHAASAALAMLRDQLLNFIDQSIR